MDILREISSDQSRSSLLSIIKNSKMIVEELVAYFPLKRHESQRQRCIQQFLRSCLWICCRGNILIEPLLSNDWNKHIFSLSLFIKNSNLVYTNKPFVSNLICYCKFTKYLFYNNHFGSDNRINIWTHRIIAEIQEACLWDGRISCDVYAKFHKDWFSQSKIDRGIQRHTTSMFLP
jgi:hypothetical protein